MGRVKRQFKEFYVNFKSNKKAMANPQAMTVIVVGVILALILGSAFLTIGLAVNSGISESVPIDANSSYYNASQTVINGTTAAYEMTSTMQLVLVAGGIIMLLLAVLGGFFYYQGSR